MQATNARYLHAKTIAQTLTRRADYRGEIYRVFIEVDRVIDLRTDRRDLFNRVAGLLQDERNIRAFATDTQGIACGPASIAIHGKAHFGADSFPYLSDRLNVDGNVAATHFDLKTGVALGLFLFCNAGNLIRCANTRCIVGRHAVGHGTAEQVANRNAVAFAEKVMDRDINRSFRIVVTVEQSIHQSMDRQRVRDVHADEIRRHQCQRGARAFRMGLGVGRPDGAGLAPANQSRTRHQLHNGRVERIHVRPRHRIRPVQNRQVFLIDMKFGDLHVSACCSMRLQQGFHVRASRCNREGLRLRSRLVLVLRRRRGLLWQPLAHGW